MLFLTKLNSTHKLDIYLYFLPKFLTFMLSWINENIIILFIIIFFFNFVFPQQICGHESSINQQYSINAREKCTNYTTNLIYWVDRC